MQKVIALYAAANRGKTTTLRKLIELLSHISDNYEIYQSSECWAYFEIKGKKVVVCTPGDSKEVIKDNIKYAKKPECDIFVTATRTRGETTDEIQRFINKEKTKLIWVKKENNKLNNNLLAANLFAFIIKSCDFDFESFIYNGNE